MKKSFKYIVMALLVSLCVGIFASCKLINYEVTFMIDGKVSEVVLVNKYGRTKISVTTSPKNNILLVHVADKDQVMRVDQKALSDWLHKRNLPIENIFEELKTTYGAVFDRNTLGAGTSYSTGGRTRVIDVPLTGNLSTLI